jgi:hypothetical protein
MGGADYLSADILRTAGVFRHLCLLQTQSTVFVSPAAPGDPQQPAQRLRAAFIGMTRGIRREEDLLCQIFRFCRTSGETAQVALNTRREVAEKTVKERGICVPDYFWLAGGWQRHCQGTFTR